MAGTGGGHRLGDPARQLALLDRALATELPSVERAELLEQRGILIAERLGNPEQALPCFREAIALAPERESVRFQLRKQLEGLERWPAVLDCLFVEASHAEDEHRVELLEHAAQIAWDHVRPDASLPWVARLRAERPNDPALLARLGEIHRRAGRFEAALRALDEEIRMRPTEEDACRLYVERARLLEREIHSPGRAIVAYQQALAAASGREQRDPILIELDRLYALTARPVERAKILEERVSRLTGEEGIELRQTLAALYCVDLAKPELAIRALLINVDATRDDPRLQMTHLGALDAALRASARPDSWARVAERELELIEAHRDVRESTPPEYQLFLREELARIYDEELGNPDRAIAHYRRVIDAHADSVRSQARLRSLLRRCGHLTELATRLATHLETDASDPTQWLELGLLREERLHDLAGAMIAYREARVHDRTALEANRGLRRCAARLHDDAALADALEAELEQTTRLDATQRAATARALGEVCWSKLHATERAIGAYEHALELEPRGLDSLRALTRIREAGRHCEETFALYRREIELLGDDESDRERAREVWLKLANGLYADEDAARACLEAYMAAAAIERLDAADELRLARLHQTLDESDAFCDIFGRWCDREDSLAGVVEHLELARHLADSGSSRAARDRAQRAAEVDPARPDAWVYLAELERSAGRFEAAADAFARAAEVADRRWAAEYCVEAGACLEGRNVEGTWDHLTRALSHDPACFDAHVAMTRIAGQSHRAAETLEHALCVFDAAESDRLDDDAAVELALLGARAALRCEEREAGRRLFAVIIAIDPDHAEALEGTARADFEVGDYRAARNALEHRLELAGENANRGLHLGMVARGLEADGLLDAAWTRYEEAIEADPDSEDAHEGLVRVHERSARPTEALESLERWARSRGDESVRAHAALRAGEHALALNQTQRAKRNLEDATRLDSGLAPAWLLLCELVASDGPTRDARLLCDQALESIEPGSFSARIALQAAQLAERAGETETARKRYAEAARWEPRCVEAALSESRLARTTGDWIESDAILARFIEAHPDPASPTLAHVYLERGRLLSGPLEGFKDAIHAYELALSLQPELHVARTALAGLLLHAPDRWSDALELHRQILAASPTNPTSLRALVQIADGRSKPDLAAAALTILHALGQAAPHEVEATQESLQFPIHAGPPMAEPDAERLRRLAHLLREELSEVLAEVETPSVDSSDETVRAAIHQIQEIEAELTAPGLNRLGTNERASLFAAIVGLFVDVGGNGGNSRFRDEIDRALGRWTRRKARRIAEETTVAEIEALDHEAWECELRALSAAQVLDGNGGDLRTVLRALLTLEMSSAGGEPCEGVELGTLASTSDSVRRLLARLTNLLCQRLEQSR